MQTKRRPKTIIGITLSGKSYYAKKTLFLEECGVLFINTLHDDADMEGWTKADSKSDIYDIIHGLSRGKKINYHPAKNIETREIEVFYVVNKLLGRENIEFILAVDEVHLYESKEIEILFKNVSQMGRHSGIVPVWISQRPQQLDRALITQSYTIIIFNTNMEDSYFKSYGINPDKLKQEIQGRPYYFCEWTQSHGLGKAQKL
jgi:hypothetical protein